MTVFTAPQENITFIQVDLMPNKLTYFHNAERTLHVVLQTNGKPNLKIPNMHKGRLMTMTINSSHTEEYCNTKGVM